MSKLVRVRNRNQITLPKSFASNLGIQEDTLLEAETVEGGLFLRVVYKENEEEEDWLTPEMQDAIDRADAGEFTSWNSVSEMQAAEKVA